MKGYITYNSIINEDFLVILVYEDCPCYYPIRQLLDLDPTGKENVGGLLLGTKVIFIDGEMCQETNLTWDHLAAIEAHEIAHSMLGHDKFAGIKEEREADELGYKLLIEKTLPGAAEILKERIKGYEEKGN